MRQAVRRAEGFLDDVPSRWHGTKVLVIGHVATRWAFEHTLRGIELEALIDETFVWQEGWTYQFS